MLLVEHLRLLAKILFRRSTVIWCCCMCCLELCPRQKFFVQEPSNPGLVHLRSVQACCMLLHQCGTNAAVSPAALQSVCQALWRMHLLTSWLVLCCSNGVWGPFRQLPFPAAALLRAGSRPELGHCSLCCCYGPLPTASPAPPHAWPLLPATVR